MPGGRELRNAMIMTFVLHNVALRELDDQHELYYGKSIGEAVHVVLENLLLDVRAVVTMRT